MDEPGCDKEQAWCYTHNGRPEDCDEQQQRIDAGRAELRKLMDADEENRNQSAT